ncbi:MAG: hypothetical protein ACYC3O_04475 [Burkholderiales bacterium]
MTLPELILFDGNWPGYVERLYSVYLDTVVNGNLRFEGLKISCQYRPASQGKHFGFWHVISDGEVEEDRLPNFRRCERINWIAYLIANAKIDPGITWWKNKRKNNTHIVIWHEAENFVVILAERGNYYLLKSAYCAESHRRATFIRERELFKSQNG